jgi:RNA polymerase sigma-70 factor, ECF subfamily
MLVDEVLACGARAFPKIAVPRAAVEALLERRPVATAIDDDLAADICLACACLEGDRHALAVFDEQIVGQVPSWIARIEADGAGQAEVQQLLRQRLLVHGDGRPAKLVDYVARGRLASWVRVVAIRLALDARRAQKPLADIERAADMLVQDDPELDYLEARYKGPFQSAFRIALDELPDRDRTVLRMHLVDDLDIDRIGALYDVHRATAARWLARARESLFEMTRSHLRAELGLDDAEFTSLVRLVRSRLDVSVCRILREADR